MYSYACSIMYRLQLPLVVVLNKNDVVSTEFAQQWLTDFDAFDEAMQVSWLKSALSLCWTIVFSSLKVTILPIWLVPWLWLWKSFIESLLVVVFLH